jgi:hypothetical protein
MNDIQNILQLLACMSSKDLKGIKTTFKNQKKLRKPKFPLPYLLVKFISKAKFIAIPSEADSARSPQTHSDQTPRPVARNQTPDKYKREINIR